MKTFISVIIMGMLALACEKPQEESPFHDGIEWQGENDFSLFKSSVPISNKQITMINALIKIYMTIFLFVNP